MKTKNRLCFHWYWMFALPRVQFFKKGYCNEWYGIIRSGFCGVNVYWEAPRPKYYGYKVRT